MAEISTKLTSAESALHASRQRRRNRLTLVPLLLLLAGMTGLGFWHVAAEMRAAGNAAHITAD
jgi:hypothetical protein